MCYISRYGSLREIKVSGGFNQSGMQTRNTGDIPTVYHTTISAKKLMSLKAHRTGCASREVGTICIRNRNRTPGSRIFQVTQFGGEQSGARAGAAWL